MMKDEGRNAQLRVLPMQRVQRFGSSVGDEKGDEGFWMAPAMNFWKAVPDIYVRILVTIHFSCNERIWTDLLPHLPELC